MFAVKLLFSYALLLTRPWSRALVENSEAFSMKSRLDHPENYLFLLSENIFIGSKYPKKYFKASLVENGGPGVVLTFPNICNLPEQCVDGHPKFGNIPFPSFVSSCGRS